MSSGYSIDILDTSMLVIADDALRSHSILELRNVKLSDQDATAIELISESKHVPIIVTETEVHELELEDDSDEDPATFTPIYDSSCTNIVRASFVTSKSQWIEDPVIRRWRNPDHRVHEIMMSVERLHYDWRNTKVGPFSPVTDKVWLEMGSVLAEIGLPWHNNQINMPDEIDTSWPFHFKSFEVDVIRAKGTRVGDPNPSGYVCNWSEANCYGIRALQQELREKCPDQKPLLVYDKIEREIPESAVKLFGLEPHRVDLQDHASDILQDLRHATQNGTRPIIFVASSANRDGQSDNMDRICEISEGLPVILHVDASRNFDYITTLTDIQRRRLGINKLTLGIRSIDRSIRLSDGSILASTIVAGGSNHISPAPVVSLKPSALGSVHTRVAYTRASDSTLAGSRDALAPLWVALQELRFGESGFNEVFQQCTSMRQALMQSLMALNVTASAPKYSLDVIIESCSDSQTERLRELGAIITTGGHVLLTVQPGVEMGDVDRVVQIFMSVSRQRDGRSSNIPELNTARKFLVPQEVIKELKDTVNSWKVPTRSAAGYPFHMGSYSALGPAISHFLDIQIPDVWVEAKASEILDMRLELFGLADAQQRHDFKGAFTNGSTMGNRVGIHTALTHFPGAYLYFSKETHYSVSKTARDSDDLTNRWSDRSKRYSEIQCDARGSMCAVHLVQQAVHDRDECLKYNQPYYMVLFLNMGTTFVGAQDNLAAIRKALRKADIEVSYIHMDGALDFGFHNAGVLLGPPGTTERHGKPVVQGLTLSHHKAMGNMVSGEVLCYSPGAQLATLGSQVDPRAVFETWLYTQIYSQADAAELLTYCRDNASRLEASLHKIDVVTKRNHDSTIVVLERPPAWVTEEFSLRPQDDWVHFITMPHISEEIVDLFVDRIADVDKQYNRAFYSVRSSLESAMGQPLTLHRVPCRSEMAGKVTALAQGLVQPTHWYFESVNSAITASLRGAMTVVAVDNHNEPQAVFLIESTRERTVRAGPVLVRSQLDICRAMLVDFAQQLVGLMARNLNVQVVTDDTSYMILTL